MGYHCLIPYHSWACGTDGGFRVQGYCVCPCLRDGEGIKTAITSMYINPTPLLSSTQPRPIIWGEVHPARTAVYHLLHFNQLQQTVSTSCLGRDRDGVQFSFGDSPVDSVIPVVATSSSFLRGLATSYSSLVDQLL
jgi:hypothetical protein